MGIPTTNIYNRYKAVTYARMWANRFNPAYPQHASFLPPNGSDCTNFVSQCLHEGGWSLVGDKSVFNRADDTQWWYGGWFGNGCSRSWGAAENLRRFASLSGRAKKLSRLMDLAPGDIVFFIDGAQIAGHVAMVTRQLRNDIEICQHSSPQNLDRRISDVVLGYVKSHTTKVTKLPDLPLDIVIQDFTKAGYMTKSIEPYHVSDTYAGLVLPDGHKLPGEM